ncbi:hypothetical protein LCGC14_1562000 [marine sediment metagenome]|uniref:Uncharacterized protein n=1 Tax=marine sediment metagenome TaxID=412755 RepID=A0A0F9LMX0_9ZZZZ
MDLIAVRRMLELCFWADVTSGVLSVTIRIWCFDRRFCPRFPWIISSASLIREKAGLRASAFPVENPCFKMI